MKSRLGKGRGWIGQHTRVVTPNMRMHQVARVFRARKIDALPIYSQTIKGCRISTYRYRQYICSLTLRLCCLTKACRDYRLPSLYLCFSVLSILSLKASCESAFCLRMFHAVLDSGGAPDPVLSIMYFSRVHCEYPRALTKSRFIGIGDRYFQGALAFFPIVICEPFTGNHSPI